MYKRIVHGLLALLLLAGLSACGQKGPLYLPDEEQQQNDNGSLSIP